MNIILFKKAILKKVLREKNDVFTSTLHSVQVKNIVPF